MNKMAKVALVLGGLALGGAAGCKKEPDAAEVHRVAGNKALAADQFAQAAEEFTKSLEADPTQEKIWEKKAFALMKAGNVDGAAEAILKTLEFKTEPEKKGEVYRNLASIYLNRNEMEKAEKNFGEALKLNPKDDVALGWMAEIASSLGGARSTSAPAVPEHLERALGYYDQVIALKPEDATPYLNKRIVMAKYVAHEEAMMASAQAEMAENAKDAAKVADAKARLEQHQTRIADLKVKYEALTKRFVELNKNKQVKATP